MFSGIIECVGEVAALRRLRGDAELKITSTFRGLALGESVAVNGACMTVTSFDPAAARFTIDISAESLSKTAGLAEPGPVNLEKALRANDRLGGHLVSGHVDGIGSVASFEPVVLTIGLWPTSVTTPSKVWLG